ncbi:DUF7366 family protein [Staphylococcus aureus]|uniref:DUF7366 family protein n=1 Tax=Staphylococcus aureus TaxID=1280 RepID=UPI00403F5527
MARRKVIRVRIKGKLMTLREVSEKYHISPELLRYRYKHKMRGDELLCGRKDSKSKDEVEYMQSQIKDEEKEREKIRKYKNKTPEEKAKIENDFIKDINDKDSEFYSPMMANMNEHELRAMLRMMPSLIDTGDDNDD